MKWLKTIALGILLWLLIFVWWSILVFSPLSMSWQYAIHYILLIPAGIFVAWLFYRTGQKMNGFLTGLILVLIGTVLDLAITVPLFTEGYAVYYSSPLLWIGFLETILVIGLYDLMKRKGLCCCGTCAPKKVARKAPKKKVAKKTVKKKAVKKKATKKAKKKK